ncbi:uncharacterized protein LOC115211734 [Octopus sinensis]|uniref:Uncharacterized protein LOC115211734 n=1 Tax=Octopus sinensis TaxID=2607531 RepID=A0A6P7SD33_9MOLL|nr:uncharacterized protein LOC115211734 [Octopus sinensis]
MDNFNASDVSSLDKKVSKHPVMVISAIVMLVIGIFGNTVSLVVLCRRRLRSINIGIFLIVFCLNDLIIVGLFSHQMLSKMFLDGSLLREIMCKYGQFLIYFTRQFSSWITVAISAHRMFAISRPFSARMKKFGWKSQVVTLISIAIILLIVNIINSRYFHFRHGSCIYDAGILFIVVNSVFYSYLPSLILITSTVAIIITLCRRPKSWSTLKNNNNIFLVLAINIMYLICSLPPSVVFPLFETEVAKDLTVKNMMAILSNFDNAFHFVLYMLSGRLFREELKKLVRRRCQPSTNSASDAIKQGRPYVIPGQMEKTPKSQ